MKSLFSNIILFAVVAPLGCGKAPVVETTVPVQLVSKAAPAKPNFTSKKYGFALYLPSLPKINSRPLSKDPKDANDQIEVFMTMPDPVSYLVIPVNLPPDEAKLSQVEFFDDSQIGIIEVSGGELIEARDEKVNGQNTRVLTYAFSLPSRPTLLFGETRLYKIGKRSFQFTAYVPKTQLDANRAQMDKVFDSIVITK